MDCMRDSFNKGITLHGRYETLAPLNHGSFGMVFMANDTTTNEVVAIKCLTKKATTGNCPSTFSVDEKSEELSIHTQLGSHPNVVNLIDSFESDAHIYLVLEFCSNGDLYEAIRLGKGPLETEHVRDFMLQLVDAVELMHSKSFYHRDIKPENIFLAQNGDMKLGDFGLATHQSWTFESTVGSDRYMAPEQYDPAGLGYAPEKADIWAIGICLLNVLFSRNPFVTPTESDPLFSDFARDPQSLFDVFPTMSQDAFEVLVQSLSLDPTKRSLAGVRDALARAISFTTDDDELDDFCNDDDCGLVPPTANREPLRTPSITSPQIDQGGAFPWARALHMSPAQQVRQLSVIHDDESYSEDLFPESYPSDWVDAHPSDVSVASALDSGLGTSLKSIPFKNSAMTRSSPMPITNSVPLPSMASVFGKGGENMVSKSWSDLWDEDEEAEQQIHAEEEEKEVSRSWSRESQDVIVDDDVTLKRPVLSERPSSSVNTIILTAKVEDIISGSGAMGIGIDGVNENGVFVFEEHPSTHQQSSSMITSPRYSPPARRSPNLSGRDGDKWAALGEKRRAALTHKTSTPELGRSNRWFMKRQGVFGNNGVSGRDLEFSSNQQHNYFSRAEKKDDHSGKPRYYWSGSNGRGGSGGHGNVVNKDRFEWVGGWNDLHL